MTSRAGGRTTVLMVSHDVEQVRRVADRVTVLDRRVAIEGGPEILATADVRELIPSGREQRKVRA